MEAKEPPKRQTAKGKFNDTGPNIQEACGAGWEFVDASSGDVVANTDDMGTMTRMRVDKKLTGEPLFAYLMVLEEELYEEDQNAKLEALAETEDQIAEGNAPSLKGNIDGTTTYVKQADLRSTPL